MIDFAKERCEPAKQYRKTHWIASFLPMMLFRNSVIINILDSASCLAAKGVPRNDGHSTFVIARSEVTKQSSLSVISGCLIFHPHYR